MVKKFGSLTGLRAIAAMMIFVYHSRKFWRYAFPDYLDRFINEWHIGVALFFVLSGFLISYNYYEKLTTLNSSSFFKYLWVRIARIYPIYFIIIVSKYIFIDCPPPLEVFMNITLLKGYFFKYLLTGLPQSWSLTVELTFYTLAPLLFWFIYRFGILKSIIGLILFNAIFISMGFLLNHFQLNTYGFLGNSNFIIIGSFQGRFMEFVVGVLLGLHLKNIKTFTIFSLEKWNTLIGFVGVLLCMFAMMQFQTSIWTHGFENHYGAIINNLILPVFIAIFIKGLATENTFITKILASKIMEQLGYASFIFYLIHINFINNIVWDFHRFPDRNFIILWVISFIGYHLLEKPIYDFLRKIILKKNT